MVVNKVDPSTPNWVLEVREQFPILHQKVHGRPLVYLDNAATTQMPEAVLDKMVEHYHSNNANVHRGIHSLSNRSTSALEEAREKTRAFLGAESASEIVFTSGTTDSINMVTRGLEESIKPSQTIVISQLEHHANYVPWQQLCKRIGSELFVLPLDDASDIRLDVLEEVLISKDVAIVAVAHVSNVTGTVNPVDSVVELCHGFDVPVLIDAAQSIRHEPLNVAELDCDYLCFSGHKILGPTGIGVLYGKARFLEDLSLSCFGGEMVDRVTFEKTTFEELPIRLEAGTPNYVGAIALGAAFDLIDKLGRHLISDHEHSLLRYAEDGLRRIDGLRILGSPKQRAGCVSFTLQGIHPFDLAKLMDAQGVAIRSGSQCAQPLLNTAFSCENVSRISPALYNTYEEIDACIEALGRSAQILRKASDQRS